MKWIEELDDLLAIVEDTAKGSEGDMITKARGLIQEQRSETRQHETIVIGEIESHIKSMMIEADEHAKMGNYAKALSLKEQTTGFKRAIDVIRKHS